MKEGLTKKAGPLPVWAWILVAGGTIGVVILWKRSKTKTVEGTEPIPEHLSIPGVEGGAGAGGGAPNPEAKTPEALPTFATEPNHTTGTAVSDFLTTEHELQEGGWERHAAAGSTAPATAAAGSAARGGTPGARTPFKTGTYKGHASHVYARAVPGGVGPGKNIVVLGGPAKRSHAKPGSHAHAKTKPHVVAHHAPARPKAPVHHATHHAPKPKPKPKPRRR